MADIDASLLIPTYDTDFGTEINNLPFKMLRTYAQGLASGNLYQTRNNDQACGVGRLFKPRYLEVTYATAEGTDVIKYPVESSDPTVINTYYNAIVNAADTVVTCVSYYGERWPRIPQNLLTSGQYDPEAAYNVSTAGNRLTGVFTYQAESLGATTITGTEVIAPFAIEALPDTLAQPRLDCLINPIQNAFCGETSDIRPRRFIGKARKQRNDALVPGSVARTALVGATLPSEILQCANDLAPLFACLEYKGEEVLNLSTLRGL